ncbi:hypothetical protein EVAR_2541_1 [Eumeta japonica]|uniref:Uncharacterized protein n=1 Tax=Eumeta variegata TaxID=151549 RepID=A0A4C1SPF6_EUMVA|nr:hypothetical protein EVAR_2541_1 [Eumeta japonica]
MLNTWREQAIAKTKHAKLRKVTSLCIEALTPVASALTAPSLAKAISNFWKNIKKMFYLSKTGSSVVSPNWKGIIRYALLTPGKSINSGLYCQQLMRLKQEVEKKTAGTDQQKGVGLGLKDSGGILNLKDPNKPSIKIQSNYLPWLLRHLVILAESQKRRKTPINLISQLLMLLTSYSISLYHVSSENSP